MIFFSRSPRRTPQERPLICPLMPKTGRACRKRYLADLPRQARFSSFFRLPRWKQGKKKKTPELFTDRFFPALSPKLGGPRPRRGWFKNLHHNAWGRDLGTKTPPATPGIGHSAAGPKRHAPFLCRKKKRKKRKKKKEGGADPHWKDTCPLTLPSGHSKKGDRHEDLNKTLELLCARKALRAEPHIFSVLVSAFRRNEVRGPQTDRVLRSPGSTSRPSLRLDVTHDLGQVYVPASIFCARAEYQGPTNALFPV